MRWHPVQVDNNNDTALRGGIFGGWIEDGTMGQRNRNLYYLVEICPLPADMLEDVGGHPYIVWTAIYNLADPVIAVAVEAVQHELRRAPAQEVTLEAAFLTLFQRGIHNTVSPTIGGDGTRTLREAMQRMGIPREALRNASQYDLDYQGNTLQSHIGQGTTSAVPVASPREPAPA